MATYEALRVALPVPLRRLFDYRPTSGTAEVVPGCRVLVPLRKRTVVGIVCVPRARSDLSARSLKSVSRVLDQQAVFPKPLFELLLWAAEYYQHPVGEILHAALPVVLRRGGALWPARSRLGVSLPRASTPFPHCQKGRSFSEECWRALKRLHPTGSQTAIFVL